MKIRSAQVIIVSLFLLFVLATRASADEIRIAVAATGQAKDAAISQQAGKAPFFLIFDGRGNLLETIENPARDQSRGAGPSAALLLADKGVTLIIAGNFGRKMKQALKEFHIQYVEKTGIANKAVQRYSLQVQ